MRISLRIFLALFVLVGVGITASLRVAQDEVKPAVRQATEDALVETANVLAELATPSLHTGDFREFSASLDAALHRRLHASIWAFPKHSMGLRVTVTDVRGTVVYDSTGRDTGKDFSKWNDVVRTLRGDYGVRTTRDDPNNPLSTVMYVAAPIVSDGLRVGVLTVAKPNRDEQPFIELGQANMKRAGFWIVALGIALGGGIAFWLDRSIRALERYATAVGDHQHVDPPKLGSPEFVRLYNVIETMRRKLEGKEYVEDYVHALTHEMKAPLSAVAAAAEILEDRPPPDVHEKFVKNIAAEARHLRELVDRMLELAQLERLTHLARSERVDLVVLARALVVDAYRLRLAGERSVTLDVSGSPSVPVHGDRFLLSRAISNLVDNGADFCRSGGAVRINLHATNDGAAVEVTNDGDPIPDFALPRVLERFYSLPRPHTGKKGTGLGLPFVKEVARLHGGTVELRNTASGVEARLTLSA